MQHGIVKSASTRKIRLAVSDGSGNCLAHGPDCGETTDFLVEIKGEEWSYGVYAPQRHILGGTPSQGESVNILLNFTQFFETRIEYRFQIFTAHSCDFLLPSYARLA